MELEYKPSNSSVQWWVFDIPAGGLTMSIEEVSVRNRTSAVEAIAKVGNCFLVKFTKERTATNAKTALDTFFRRSGVSGLGSAIPLDKAHLQS